MSTTAFTFPTFVASAPGKLILAGEHAVVHGSHALSTVVDRRTYAEFAPSAAADSLLQLYINDSDFKGLYSFPLAVVRSHLHPEPLPSPLPSDRLAKFEALFKDYPGFPTLPLCAKVFLLYYCFFLDHSKQIPMVCRVSSELPIGAGLGSSASFCGALAAGFHRLNHNDFSSPIIPPADIQLINSWTFEGERLIHLNPSGVDNTTVTHGGILIFRRQYPNQFLSSLPPIRILVTNTKQEKSTAKLVAGVGKLRDTFPSVIQPIIQSIDSLVLELISKIKELKEFEMDRFEEELGRLFEINQNLLNALGVGHPTLNRVVEAAKSRGLAAKLTGAGGGGCAITLLPRNIAKETVDELIAFMEREYGYESFETLIGQAGAEIRLNSTLEKEIRVLDKKENATAGIAADKRFPLDPFHWTRAAGFLAGILMLTKGISGWAR